jgi:hypothetical protein
VESTRNFKAFTDLEPLEFKVPAFCLATGCVSLRRDGRYQLSPEIDDIAVRRIPAFTLAQGLSFRFPRVAERAC